MNEDEKKQVIALWELGLTGKEIGEHFGVSRCVILGLINRLRNNGYQFERPFEKDRARRENVFKAVKPKKIKKEKIEKPKIEKAKVESIKVEKTKDQKIAKEPAIEYCESVDIMGLKPYSCRYPISADDVFPVLFCGKPQEHGSYCKEHGAICYLPTKYSAPRVPD